MKTPRKITCRTQSKELLSRSIKPTSYVFQTHALSLVISSPSSSNDPSPVLTWPQPASSCSCFSRRRRSCRRAPVCHPLRHVRRLPDAEKGRRLVRAGRAQAVADSQLVLQAAKPRVLRVDEGQLKMLTNPLFLLPNKSLLCSLMVVASYKGWATSGLVWPSSRHWHWQWPFTLSKGLWKLGKNNFAPKSV